MQTNNLKQFKKNELVVFIDKSPDGEIYSVEIGKIKGLCKDGAFVYYHTGDTAVKTNYKDLYKIKNAYAIDNLGGNNNLKTQGLQMNSNTLKQLEKEEGIKILKDNEIRQDQIYDAYIILKDNLPDGKIINVKDLENDLS